MALIPTNYANSTCSQTKMTDGISTILKGTKNPISVLSLREALSVRKCVKIEIITHMLR